VAPIVEPTILTIIAVIVLLAAIYAVSHRRGSLIIGLSVSTLSIILIFWAKAAPNHWLIVISHGTLAVLTGFLQSSYSATPWAPEKSQPIESTGRFVFIFSWDTHSHLRIL